MRLMVVREPEVLSDAPVIELVPSDELQRLVTRQNHAAARKALTKFGSGPARQVHGQSGMVADVPSPVPTRTQAHRHTRPAGGLDPDLNREGIRQGAACGEHHNPRVAVSPTGVSLHSQQMALLRRKSLVRFSAREPTFAGWPERESLTRCMDRPCVARGFRDGEIGLALL
jgi:hypothetical protein